VIADGLHVAPSIIKLLLAVKGIDHTILITDAISATGMPDGKYKLGSFEVMVTGDRCDLDGRLAGSVLTLDRAVRNVMKFVPLGLQNAVRLATLNPARFLGIMEERGTIAPGHLADLVVLNQKGNVIAAMAAGQMSLT
jgi:N-acetylglucosamine-6-phosphate deacetylase